MASPSFSEPALRSTLTPTTVKPTLETRHLQAFLAVADALSFSRAAERLGISQPPLSRQIQRLEAKLGFQLFDRRRSQVRLTAAGEVFARSARQLIHHMEQGIEEAKLVSQGLVGRLIVGVEGSAIAAHQAVQLITAHQLRSPQLQIQIKELTAFEQLQALQAHEIGIGFVSSSATLPDRLPGEIFSQAVICEPLWVALPTSHVLAVAPQLSLIDIATEAVVMDESWRAAISAIAKKQHHMTFHPPIAQSASSLQLMLSFVEAGTGISLVPESAQKSLPHLDVSYRPLYPPLNIDVLSVIWQAAETQPAITAWLATMQ